MQHEEWNHQLNTSIVVLYLNAVYAKKAKKCKHKNLTQY